MNELTVRNINAIDNKELKAATKRIAKAISGVKKNYFAIAVNLNDIDEKNLYEADGYASTAEYAEAVFGIKKAQTYNLIRLGREYITPELTTNIPHDDDDFNATQVIKMFPLGDRESVIEFVKSEDITPAMTTKEIVEKVKAYTKDEDEEVIETTGTVEDAEGESDSKEHTADYDADYEKIRNILIKYDVETRAEMLKELEADVVK